MTINFKYGEFVNGEAVAYPAEVAVGDDETLVVLTDHPPADGNHVLCVYEGGALVEQWGFPDAKVTRQDDSFRVASRWVRSVAARSLYLRGNHEAGGRGG